MRKQEPCSAPANPLNDRADHITKARSALLLCLCSIALLLATSVAFADGKHGRGHYYRGYRGYYYGPSIGLGFSYVGPYWGASWGYPYYPYFYPYYPAYYPYYYGPGITIETSPPVYIERGQKTEPPDMPAIWFYCPDSKKYYPYVSECPGGWQSVPAQPTDKER